MCAPSERVRRGNEGATLARHSGQNRVSAASVLMQLQQPEFSGRALSLV